MACPEGQYFCNDRGKCMPIPKGHKVRKDGELVKEVAPPGWGHTKAEKEKTDPSKPKSKIGGSAAAFDRARKEGRFKGSKEDMFKIMWWMYNKGGKPKGKPHYKPGTDEKYKKYQDKDEKNEEVVLEKKVTGGKAKWLSRAIEKEREQHRAQRRVIQTIKKSKQGQKSIAAKRNSRIEASAKRNQVKVKKMQTQEEKKITPMQDNNLFGNAYAGSELAKKKKKVKEGVSFKKFYDTAKKAISKKQKERKPQMDSTTKKLHKWRTDKEQAEREKYVTFTKPVEDD